ncbi:hypothetical protein WMY93_030609 [Mugilogobius chulae]|uniref:Uncharacterized protein n=1 Tax=Mugilogobius chulae TaxID=88201 RepID=A0AAW0MUZ7_9GOBI
MAAPGVSRSRGGSAGSSPTLAAGRGLGTGLGNALGPELDFRSGARMEELSRLIQELSKHEQREYDDQRALEIHTAKDFIFSMLGMVQKLDQKLPVANEYLLLSGAFSLSSLTSHLSLFLQAWCRSWTRSSPWLTSTSSSRGRARGRGTRRWDTRAVAAALRRGNINKWKDCCTVVEHVSGNANYFFSPTLVADWFYSSISTVLSEVQRKPQRGMPRVEKVARHGTIISVILGVGSSRVLYDIVPVVSFKGWPAVAQSWLMENHFWDGKITEEEVISGFYLVPACSYKGRKRTSGACRSRALRCS